MAETLQESLEQQIKELAKNAGAALVGITSKDRLITNECSDPTYLLPSAESVIGYAVPLNKEIVHNFLNKTNLSAQKEMSRTEGRVYHKIEDIGNVIKEFLESKGYEAVNCEVNMDYRYYKHKGKSQIDQLKQLIELVKKDPNNPLIQALRKGKIQIFNPNLTPKISHRYVSVACGIGRLGYSGNLITKDYGSIVYLGSVITNAKLKPDPYLEENPCTRCKVCVAVCQGQMFDAKETQIVKIGEIEEVIGKKHSISKCALCCSGFTGQTKFKKWSTWSPLRVEIPENDDEVEKKMNDTLIDYILAGGLKAKNVLRLATDSQLGFSKAVKKIETFDVTCGFCQLVCWETEKERRENVNIIRSSGIIELDNENKKFIRKYMD